MSFEIISTHTSELEDRAGGGHASDGQESGGNSGAESSDTSIEPGQTS